MQLLIKHKKLFGFFAWMMVVFVAAAIGAAASVNAGLFYAQIIRPDWAPPSWVFGPAWTFLYALMGIASWLVWSAGNYRIAQAALILFIVQLVFNALWSWLFFGWHLGALAFIDILLLLALIVATLISFWRIKPLAGALLLPYLLWVIFASALNYAIWQLNPQVLG